MSETKDTATHSGLAEAVGSALFVPLRSEFFEAFEKGWKQWEYRMLGPRWNARTCAIGRRVVLSRGYGKSRRLTGTITDFLEVNHPEALPGWLACYGVDAGRAACFRIELDVPQNAPRSATEGRK